MVARSISLAVAATAVISAALQSPAHASTGTATTTTTLTAATHAYIGTPVTLTAAVTSSDPAAPLVDQQVEFDQYANGQWVDLGVASTDQSGYATWNVTAQAGTSTYRSVYGGDDTYAPSASTPVDVVGVKAPSTLTITGPSSIVDEHQASLRVSWQTRDGRPINAPVTLLERDAGTDTWKTVRTLTTVNGAATTMVKPRVDSFWKVQGAPSTWYLAAASSVLGIDNVPPGSPVTLPAAAPAPRITLPAQQRAIGDGPHAMTTRIPDAMWSSMVGRTWHRGCPVGRARLRLVRVNYWGFDGYRHRGELVVNSAIADKTARAFSLIYSARVPIRAMYREDRFGYSARTHGADDYASMAADNTSAFNCRIVDGSNGTMSPHATGRAIDINTWENPYHSAKGWTPNSWWQHHGGTRYVWRSRTHPLVRAMLRAGFHWTYGTEDSQHFDG